MRASEAKEKLCPILSIGIGNGRNCKTDACMWWTNYSCVIVEMWLNPVISKLPVKEE